MLHWVGKRPLGRVTAFPAQQIETFDPSSDAATRAADENWADWPSSYPSGGLLFHGDNKEVLAHLLANGFRGKVKLIYIDPPFILIVCLGKEQAADVWLEDWNRHRKGKGSINRIREIELRTDPRYGKFIVHSPAEARVEIVRENGSLRVEIKGFISPTILERLEMDLPLFRAKVPDWRSMVDCVLIDPAYDGEVFRVGLSDVPERKDALVEGSYELSAPEGETTVGVKIIDMLGEEVLLQQRV